MCAKPPAIRAEIQHEIETARLQATKQVQQDLEPFRATFKPEVGHGKTKEA